MRISRLHFHNVQGNPMNSAGLASIREQLQNSFENVFVRGQDAGMFIFVQTQERAIEISPTPDGKWWMEMWMVLDAGAEQSVSESTVDSVDKAIARATQWLSHGKLRPNIA